LNLPASDTISSITVKMEGISRTHLDAMVLDNSGERPRERRRAATEIHRVLYIVQTVFPSQAIQDQAISNSGFTLKAGQYEYPFRLRIPINVSCTKGIAGQGSLLQTINFDTSTGMVDVAKPARNHTKGTLPPSLSGVAGDIALIRYFLKVTVNRPKFYKTNMRSEDPFVLLPIEPPRPPPTKKESFARRKFDFMAVEKEKPSLKPFLGSIFSKKRGPEQSELVPKRVSVEIRLPSPPIFIPTVSLPIRILLKKLDDFEGLFILRSLKITLISKTQIRAQDLSRDILDRIVISNETNIQGLFKENICLSYGELEVDSALWSSRSLPDTISPTFQTCNISRSYKLLIDIGISRVGEEEITSLPLIHDIQVYSGIPPPPKLISAAVQPQLPLRQSALSGNNGSIKSTVSSLNFPNDKTSAGSHSAVTTPESSPVSPIFELPHTSYHTSSNATESDAPPPAYEDVIADDIAPVDGPRRRYQQVGAYYQNLPDDCRDAH
jgi:hypothetical protein